MGKDVYLFDVPATALTGIIVGSLATEDSIEQLVRIIGDNPDLAHLRIGCALAPSDQTVAVEFWRGSIAEIRKEFRAAS
jgi:hypothetical protein